MLLVASMHKQLRVLASCSYCHNLNDAQAAALPYTTSYRDNQCVMSVGDCLLVLLALWIIFFVAAVYFSNVWPNEHGVRRRYATQLYPCTKACNGVMQHHVLWEFFALPTNVTIMSAFRL